MLPATQHRRLKRNRHTDILAQDTQGRLSPPTQVTHDFLFTILSKTTMYYFNTIKIHNLQKKKDVL